MRDRASDAGYVKPQRCAGRPVLSRGRGAGHGLSPIVSLSKRWRALAAAAVFVIAAPISDAKASADDVLAPEGITLGMPGEEAQARLAAAGFTQPHSQRCVFERQDDPARQSVLTRVGLTLELLEDAPKNLAEKREEMLRNVLNPVPDPGCGAAGAVVTSISWFQRTSQAAPFNATAEREALIALFGEYASCQRILQNGFNWCVWRDLPDDSLAAELRVSVDLLSRNILLTGDPVALRPRRADRANGATLARAEALNICRNYRSGDLELYRTLVDCKCIAEKVEEAYAVGLAHDVTTSTVDDYKNACPGEAAQIRAYFRAQCLGQYTKGVEGAWARAGGCDCYGDHWADAYRRDPDASFPNMSSLGAAALLACDYAKRDEIAAAAAKDEASASTPAIAGFMSLPSDELFGVANPVVFSGRWSEDATARVHRAMHLALLNQVPGLINEPGFAAQIAWENLPQAESEKFLAGHCPGLCLWQGANEFERRDAFQTFLDGPGRNLPALAATAPDELTMLHLLMLAPYDEQEQVIRVEVVDQAPHAPYRIVTSLSRTEDPSVSIFGHREPDRALPREWRLEPLAAKAVTQIIDNGGGHRPGSKRRALLAVTYKIGAAAREETTSGQLDFGVKLQPLRAAIYKETYPPSQKLADYDINSDGILTGGRERCGEHGARRNARDPGPSLHAAGAFRRKRDADLGGTKLWPPRFGACPYAQSHAPRRRSQPCRAAREWCPAGDAESGRADTAQPCRMGRQR